MEAERNDSVYDFILQLFTKFQVYIDLERAEAGPISLEWAEAGPTNPDQAEETGTTNTTTVQNNLLIREIQL